METPALPFVFSDNLAAIPSLTISSRASGNEFHPARLLRIIGRRSGRFLIELAAL